MGGGGLKEQKANRNFDKLITDQSTRLRHRYLRSPGPLKNGGEVIYPKKRRHDPICQGSRKDSRYLACVGGGKG